MRFDDKQFIAKIIKTARNRAKLTQAELAEQVGLSDQHISRIEKGCYIPSLSPFFKIVKVLDIDLKDFGYDSFEILNPTKSKLFKMIKEASDARLVFYEKLLDATNESFSKIKEKLF